MEVHGEHWALGRDPWIAFHDTQWSIQGSSTLVHGAYTAYSAHEEHQKLLNSPLLSAKTRKLRGWEFCQSYFTGKPAKSSCASDSSLSKRDFSSRLEVTILQKIETRFLLPALRMTEGLGSL